MSRFSRFLEFKKPKFFETLVKINQFSDDPFENLEELDSVDDLESKRCFFTQLLQRGLVNVMSTLDVSSASELTQDDSIVIIFIEVLFRIFLFGFRGDNYKNINEMIEAASDKLPKLTRLIEKITTLRPQQSQEAGRFYGFVMLLLNESWFLDFVSLFHNVDFASEWYEKWSFLGQDKYISMVETIGDALNQVKFNLNSFEGRGSIFDQVRLKRDKDGIIRKCLPTYNLWLDGKPRSAEENKRLFTPLSQNRQKPVQNPFSELKEEAKLINTSKQVEPNLETRINRDSFQATVDCKYHRQTEEPMKDEKNEEEEEEVPDCSERICQTSPLSRDDDEDSGQVPQPKADEKRIIETGSKNHLSEIEKNETTNVNPELTLDEPKWPSNPEQLKRCGTSDKKTDAPVMEYSTTASNNSEVANRNSITISNDGDSEGKVSLPIIDDSPHSLPEQGITISDDSNKRSLVSSFPEAVFASKEAGSSSLPTTLGDSVKGRSNKKHRAKNVARLADAPSLESSLRITSVLDGSNTPEFSLPSSCQNANTFIESPTKEDLWTRPSIQPSVKIPATCLENEIFDTTSIQSPSIVEQLEFEPPAMPRIESDSFIHATTVKDFDMKRTWVDTETDYDIITSLVQASKPDEHRKEFPDSSLSILNNSHREWSQASINPTPPASIQQSLPLKTRMTNESFLKKGSPFWRSKKPEQNLKNTTFDIDERGPYRSSSSSTMNDNLEEKKEQVLSSSSEWKPHPIVTMGRRMVTEDENSMLYCWKKPMLNDKLIPNAVKRQQNEFIPKLLDWNFPENPITDTRKFYGWLFKFGTVTKAYKRRYFKCNLDKDFTLRYWKTEDTLKNPEGTINLLEIVDVCSCPGKHIRRSNSVVEMKESICSEIESQITLHTQSKIFILQTKEFAAEWLSLFSTALIENEIRFGLENEFEEKVVDDRKSITGYLMKKGVRNTAWRRRYFILEQPKSSPPFLKYYRSREAKNEKGMIKLGDTLYVGPCLDSDVILHNPYAFEVFERKRVWTLACNNSEQFKTWVEAISTAVQRYKIEKCADPDLCNCLPRVEIIRAGYMDRRTSSTKLTSKKIGKFSWKTQYVVLTDRELWFCNTMSKYHNLQRLDLLKLDGSIRKFEKGEGFLRMRGLDVRRLVGNFFGREGVVGIKGPEKTVFLHAPDEHSLNGWISAICDVAGCKEAAVPASTRIFI